MNIDKLFIIIFLLFTAVFAAQRTKETLMNPHKEEGEIKERISFFLLSSVYVLVCSVAVLELLLITSKINLTITFIGIFLYIFAFIPRLWAVRTLGRYYSPYIEIRKDHPLIIEGPYRLIRHPLYLGVVLELIGFVLIPNSYYALLLAIFLYIPILLVRMTHEETAMIEKFGSEYLHYKKEVNALLPLKKYTR